MNEATASRLEITLRPHRSLGAFGLKLVFGSMIASILVIAGFFIAWHAWPVLGFMGLDVVALIAAFALNNRAANRREEIAIDGDEVVVNHISLSTTSKRTFNRRWLRVELEHDDARDLTGRLFLVSSGKRTEIGSFLGAEERIALARQLRAEFINPKI